MALVIRQLVPGDEAPLIDLGHEMWAESDNFNKHPLSDQKLKELAAAIHISPALGCFVALNDKGPQGIWAGIIQPLWYSDDVAVMDIVFYVRKQYRGTSMAVRLLKKAEKWGLEMGAKEFSIGLSSGIDTDRTSCFFSKMGYIYDAIRMTKEIS